MNERTDRFEIDGRWVDLDVAFEECCEAGYIGDIEEEKGYGITIKKYKLLDDGVEFLNKGEQYGNTKGIR